MMTGEAHRPERATPLQVARTVLWSFLGIRRRAAYEKDAKLLTLRQVIAGGIIGAVVFVLGLVLLVRFITS